MLLVVQAKFRNLETVCKFETADPIRLKQDLKVPQCKLKMLSVEKTKINYNKSDIHVIVKLSLLMGKHEILVKTR